MKTKATTADILTTNHGTMISIAPKTAKGRQWMYSNVPDSRARMNRSVDCDHHCGIDILEGALAAGLRLQDSQTGRLAGV